MALGLTSARQGEASQDKVTSRADGRSEQRAAEGSSGALSIAP